MGRDASMLTPDQREYLRGEKDYNQQVENNTRYEIRKRVRDALLDFGLLLEEMDARDREQLFKDVRPPSLREDDQFDEESFRDDGISGLVQALGFLYLGADEVGIPFENALEQAIVRARGADSSNPFVARTVEVSVDEALETDVGGVVRKIERGDRLDDVEFFGLTRLVLSDLDTFVRQLASADVDVMSKLDGGESLTRGESLVVVARTFDDVTQFREYDLFELLHDDVITHLGLSNARNLFERPE